MNKKWPLISLGLLLITIAIAWFLTQPDTVVKNIQNVVLISIDTCRADYLSCYGYPRKTTPNIDAIAAELTDETLCSAFLSAELVRAVTLAANNSTD